MQNGTRENEFRRTLQTMADADANRFNLKCMSVMAAMALLTELLNELGLFTVEKTIMRPSMAIAFITFLLPTAVCFLHRRRHADKAPLTERAWFRKLIIVCALFGAAFICVTLSFHALLFTVIPILIASQYGSGNNDFGWVTAASILLVPVAAYGSYFFGATDRNFFRGMLTDAEARVLANRVAFATRERMVSLFFHYVLPRVFGVVAVAVLAFGITRRNGRSSEKQFELSEKIQEEMARRHEQQSRVIELLANVIETRDASTGKHIIHTKQYVEMIARAMQRDEKYRDTLDDETVSRIVSAAPLHDVGKIVVPDAILLKPARLTAEEFERMKTHTTAGGKLIKDFFEGVNDREFLKIAEDIAVSHHEKWDGSGYPKGLRGTDIPLAARIMAIADVFDALVSVRVYKDAVEPRQALDVIFSESGSHFDPELIRIVRTIADDMAAVAGALD